jgi:hypothetical protein
MGRHTQKFRDLLASVPKPDNAEGFTPELASMILTRTLQHALHVIAELEENIEDLETEITGLQSQLIDAAPAGKESDWLNRAKYKKQETKTMLDDLLSRKDKKDE